MINSRKRDCYKAKDTLQKHYAFFVQKYHKLNYAEEELFYEQI